MGIVLAHYGRWISQQQLHEECPTGRSGFSAADIVKAAADHGLEASGWRKKVDQLRDLVFPAILHWSMDHFVVLEGVGRNRFYLNDPAFGRRTVNAGEFDRNFTGVVLTFEPGPEFRPTRKPPGLLRRLIPWLRGDAGAIAYIAACGLMLALLLLATPLLLSVFVDHVFGRGEQWGGLLAVALLVPAGLVYLLTWFKLRFLRKLSLKLAIDGSIHCISHLLRLAIEFFNQRLAGDVVGRVQSIDRISTAISSHFLDLLIELMASLLFFAVMLIYDPALAAIVLVLAGLQVVLMRAVTRIRVVENHKLLREQGLMQGHSASGLSHMEFLRSTGTDDHFFARWGGHQARELLARQRFAELGHVNAALPGLFLLLGSAAVLLLGAQRVIVGEMTLGTLMGFYVLAGMFLAPVGRFVSFADQLQTLEADLERLDSILTAPTAGGPPSGADSDARVKKVAGRLRLTGEVELRGVTFGYERGNPPVIDNLSLTIRPGQRVAFVGSSGSGKSTLAQLAAGILQPWSGEILFDGIPLGDVPADVFSGSFSLVEQKSLLFSGTVRENLTLWNPTVPDVAVIDAARDACIHDEIIARPLGYDSAVDEGGVNFSGGQRQRLELARALTNNPSILILDEATSALDATTEERIDRALRRRGVSCLIVAHRLSTIRDCDRIVVMDGGREVQSGTHEELMADGDGRYASLIHSAGGRQ